MKMFILGLVLGGVVMHFGPKYCFKKSASVASSAMHGVGSVVGSVAK
jgi:hypothetical protein